MARSPQEQRQIEDTARDGARRRSAVLPVAAIAASLIKHPLPEPTVTRLRLIGEVASPLKSKTPRFAYQRPACEKNVLRFLRFPCSNALNRDWKHWRFKRKRRTRPARAASAAPAFGVVQIGLTGGTHAARTGGGATDLPPPHFGHYYIGILSTNLLARRIITPLRNLAAGARKVGEGDLSTFVVPTTQTKLASSLRSSM